jgi:glycosyltransferase involved in cell wall biosynthesis
MVAVLVPLYRGDRIDYFKLAIASILGQEYPSDRIRIYLVIDGPLPEMHESVVSELSGHLYKIVRLPENRGLAVALNVALDSVEDEQYLLRMDSDDIMAPERVRMQVEFMEQHRDVDLLGCEAQDIDEHGNGMKVRRYPETHGEIMRLLPRMNPILHPTYCIRGTTMARDRVRYPNAYLTEDYAFLFAVAHQGWRLHNLQCVLLQWRTNVSFFKRRSDFRRGWVEFVTASRGIQRIYGWSPELVWPVVRFTLRLLPSGIVRHIYSAGIRDRFLKRSKAGDVSADLSPQQR